MSKKYIDREKVETWLLTETMCLDTDPDREYVVEKLRQDVPNEEVEPVVYCKDCIYDDNCFAQSILKEMSRIPFDKNKFFCPDGKRREGGADE